MNHFTAELCRCVRKSTHPSMCLCGIHTGLHIKPLAPLLSRRSIADGAFMANYTKPAFFVSELLLFILLAGEPKAR